MDNKIILSNTEATAITATNKVREQNGDIAQLTAIERKFYYLEMCKIYNLDPHSFPFDYVRQEDKLKLYLNCIGAAQIRDRYKISIFIKSKEIIQDMWIVTCIAHKGDRTEEATGAASFVDKLGKIIISQKANALKKAESQARRRATLAICGYGFGADDDENNILHAKSYDPPIDVLPVAVEAPAWKNWKNTEDAINWAKSQLPDSSSDYIQEIMLKIEPDHRGKKAPRFYEKIIQMAAQEF